MGKVSGRLRVFLNFLPPRVSTLSKKLTRQPHSLKFFPLIPAPANWPKLCHRTSAPFYLAGPILLTGVEADLNRLMFLLTLLASLNVAACANSGLTGETRKTHPPANPPVPAKTTPETPTPAPSPGTVNSGGSTSPSNPGVDSGQTQTPVVNPPAVTDDGRVTTVSHVCKDGAPQIYPLVGSGDKVIVEGELCPRAFGKLTVMFVVDFSGSMKDSDPRGGIFSGWSCGRSAAAQAILSKLKADMRSGDDVRVGFISFGTAARVQTAPRPIANFAATTFNFCGDDAEATNYEAAFQLTEQTLSATDGNKIVYFISDGTPTASSAGQADNDDAQGLHKNAGLTAATSLKTKINNLTLGAIFLNKGGANSGAQNYLTQITGDPSRVRLATDARDLAQDIIQLSIPKFQVRSDTVSALLSATGFPDTPVKIDAFTQNPAKPQVWKFRTAEFRLLHAPNTATMNKFTVKVLDDRGTAHEEALQINYKPR